MLKSPLHVALFGGISFRRQCRRLGLGLWRWYALRVLHRHLRQILTIGFDGLRLSAPGYCPHTGHTGRRRITQRAPGVTADRRRNWPTDRFPSTDILDGKRVGTHFPPFFHKRACSSTIFPKCRPTLLLVSYNHHISHCGWCEFGGEIHVNAQTAGHSLIFNSEKIFCTW